MGDLSTACSGLIWRPCWRNGVTDIALIVRRERRREIPIR